MSNLIINKIEKIINEIGWSISIEQDTSTVMFSMISPASQDFNVYIDITTINIPSIVKALEEQYENFDISQETYYWLDNSGHGKCGSPYDMRDIYNDMEYCCNKISTLYEKISSIEEDTIIDEELLSIIDSSIITNNELNTVKEHSQVLSVTYCDESSGNHVKTCYNVLLDNCITYNIYVIKAK